MTENTAAAQSADYPNDAEVEAFYSDATADADAVNAAFTAAAPTAKPRRRSKRVVETKEYAGMCRRTIAALGRRVGEGDVEAIVELVRLSETLDEAMHSAVRGLRAEGYSWGEIASRMDVSRQAVYQRFGKTEK